MSLIMIDVYNFYVVAYRRFTYNSKVLGLFFSEGEAVSYRDAFHSTAKVFKITKSDIVIDDYGIKLKTGLVPVK